MSRSRNSRKGSQYKAGKEYWGRRPFAGAPAKSTRSGVSTKTLTHRVERRRAKEEERQPPEPRA